MIKNNVLILGITTLLAASITVIAIGTPVLSNGFNMSAKENETVHTLVITSGENGNLYCKSASQSGGLYTYYTISSEGTRFLVYSTTLFQEGLKEGDRVTEPITLPYSHNIQTRKADDSPYYGRIANLLTINASYTGNVTAKCYPMYFSDDDDTTTGSFNLTKNTTIDFEQNKSGQYPDRFKVRSGATTMTINSITLTYSC